MKIKADLHVHSNFSDGSDHPFEVIKKAKQSGITHLSFVDHDTTRTYPVAKNYGDHLGITVIPGVEISAYDFKRKRKVHLLGYDYQFPAVHIENCCQELLARRHVHSLWQLEQIKKAGYKIEAERMLSCMKCQPILYKQFIMHGISLNEFSSEEYQTLYRKLFKGDGVANGDIIYIDVFEAIKAIQADGGKAVVAHPGQLDSYDLIPELAEAGLAGIEYLHPDHTEEDFKRVKQLAKEHHLFLTGGSDYHGAFGEIDSLGEYFRESIFDTVLL